MEEQMFFDHSYNELDSTSCLVNTFFWRGNVCSRQLSVEIM